MLMTKAAAALAAVSLACNNIAKNIYAAKILDSILKQIAEMGEKTLARNFWTEN